MSRPVDIAEIGYALGLILALGLIIVLLRRHISEGFEGQEAIKCGINAPCPGHLKCLNGFCADTEPVPVKEASPVPLLPPGGPAPYF
jgi:hypothetical protein